MTRRKQTWSDLPPAAKRLVIGASMLHLCLVGVAHADLTRRPAEQIRGPRWMCRSAFATRCPEQYGAMIEAAAFVNWRRIESDSRPIIALSFH